MRVFPITELRDEQAGYELLVNVVVLQIWIS